MKVSAVLPLLDGMPHLPASLASITAQTLPPIEVVVADGGSTDGSLAACDAAGARVVDASDTGLSGAYNRAAEAATGDLLAFGSDDDLWHPEKLARQVRALAEGADASLCVVESFLDGPAPPGFRHELLEAPRVMRIAETLVVRRSAWERVGGFRADVEPAGDVDWYARAADAGLRFAVVDGEPLLRKRFHGGSNTHGSVAMNPAILRAMRSAIERRRA